MDRLTYENMKRYIEEHDRFYEWILPDVQWPSTTM